MRKLKRVKLAGEKWFIDLRLEEYRSVNEPWKSVPFKEMDNYINEWEATKVIAKITR